ncbi:septal ring lytic transglycosylase RlpA family protein [Arenibaculum pallidiluteum]|uniref:septal ring lytic transglycosylase RlpA family protein n=1 Tax=Arenibaculum pallidiluteum TaxID=2812559 RepID=UPI001F34E42C|nr:septal ring lytic transglycosylase RlpA family protein [Arenibaculum pallidiluteum]
MSHPVRTGFAAGMIVGLALLPAPLLAQGPKGKEPDVPPPKVEVAPDGEPVVVHEGEASFYGPGFHGKKTATGETFNQNGLSAASRELPMGTKATVINKENGKEVEVKINDHGPHVDGRVIDLSKGAAKRLDMIDDGVSDVRVELKPSEQPTEKAKSKVEEKANSMGGDAADNGDVAQR